jgi:hypothetical protein
VGKILAAGFVPLYLLQLNIATDYGLLNIAWSTTVIFWSTLLQAIS